MLMNTTVERTIGTNSWNCATCIHRFNAYKVKSEAALVLACMDAWVCISQVNKAKSG